MRFSFNSGSTEDPIAISDKEIKVVFVQKAVKRCSFRRNRIYMQKAARLACPS